MNTRMSLCPNCRTIQKHGENCPNCRCPVTEEQMNKQLQEKAEKGNGSRHRGW